MRAYSKITKKRFALMVDIGRPFLNKIENGTADPRLSILAKLADALATTPDYLLERHTDEEIRTEVDRRKNEARANEARHAQPY